MNARQAIVEASQRLQDSGLNSGTSGNISMRHGAALLITPTSVAVEDMTADDIVEFDTPSGPSAGQRPSSEWRFHRDIYQARADVLAIVHAHPPHATALSMLRQPLPAVHYMIAAFGTHQVACSDYATYGTQALSDAVITALGTSWGCLLGSHGMLTCGETLAHALWRAEELEALSQQFILAKQAGDPVILPKDEIDRVIEKFASGYGVSRQP